LWENNIYFERAISAFISYLDHRIHTTEEVREHLNSVERQTVKVHGYGLKSFRRSLVQCFEDLTSAPLTDEKHRKIVSFVNIIAEQEMELLKGVAETLPILAKRHRLIVVTKGDQKEQTEKLQRSGLAPFFAAVEVLTEKHESSYRDLVERHICNPATTWMIGNSPKSDINPALAAGLNAVFVPHDFTWILEHELLDAPPQNVRLIQLAGFTELLQYF
jgi:putative hydrolase of the HAD superfamily